MADIRIRKRKRLRNKEVRALADQMEEQIGIRAFEGELPVDRAESPDFDLIFVGNDIFGLVKDDVPFLTVRGVLEYNPEKRFVTVDMGAVPFITNGADCMGPGIVEADDDIAEGDYVWIRDIRNKRCLAIGVAMRDTAALRGKKPGKAIKSLTYVGDKLWKAGE